MANKKKIFIMVMPSLGHIYPITGLAEELMLRQNYELIFYGNQEHQEIIEKTGAKFRLYPNTPLSDCRVKPLNEDRHDVLEELFTKMIDYSYKTCPILLDEIERENPNMIIYDHFSFAPRYVIKIMETRFKKGISKTPPPLALNFYTCFAAKKDLYPLEKQIKESVGSGYRLALTMAKLIYKQTIFSWKYDLDIYDPVNFIYNESEGLNIVTVFPELHPFYNKFPSNYKFVGCCVSEKLRKFSLNNKDLDRVLEYFPVINPNFTIKMDQGCKLVYASLGTVFNNNKFIYDMIIESIQLYNQSNYVKDPIKVIISVGKDNFKTYQTRVLNNKIPQNVFLFESVSQIDVLERASLFITHCGMNSASESIQYGVPMICLPIKVDQPLVAQRLVDDLNLGVRFDPLNMSSFDLKNAIENILRDDSYLKRILEFTKISRNYNGSELSATLVE